MKKPQVQAGRKSLDSPPRVLSIAPHCPIVLVLAGCWLAQDAKRQWPMTYRLFNVIGLPTIVSLDLMDNIFLSPYFE